MPIRSWLSFHHAIEIEAQSPRGELELWAAASVRSAHGSAPLAHVRLPLAGGEILHALLSPDAAFAALLREEFFGASPWSRATVMEGAVEVRPTGDEHVDFRVALKGQVYSGWLQSRGALRPRCADPAGDRPWTQLDLGIESARARVLRGAETLLLVAPGAPAPTRFRAAWRPSGTWAR